MIKSVIVGTDGSETANQAVRAAATLAGANGARLTIVSAFVPVSRSRVRAEARQAPSDVAFAVNPREDVEDTLKQAVALAKSVGAEHVRTASREGDPAEAIIDVAEELHADLLVIGNRGMADPKAKRFLLSSVPDKVSHHAPCSVLIVRTT